MRTIFFTAIITLSAFCKVEVYSQTVQYPSNITLSNLTGLNNDVTKANTFPFWVDNVHSMPGLKNKRLWSGELAGINLQNNVPKVCLDDFRYGHKYDNSYGEDGLGYLSLMYWLPSNGNYLLFLYILENGMDHYKSFFITTSLSGAYIDHLLVNDGWYDTPNSVNFTQAKLNADLTLTLYEIRNLNASYVSISDLISFTGQKATYQYTLNTSGRFVLKSTVLGTQRTYNVSELKGLISNLN